MGSLGLLTLICATPANGQTDEWTDRRMDGWTDGRQMLGYVMSFAN